MVGPMGDIFGLLTWRFWREGGKAAQYLPERIYYQSTLK